MQRNESNELDVLRIVASPPTRGRPRPRSPKFSRKPYVFDTLAAPPIPLHTAHALRMCCEAVKLAKPRLLIVTGPQMLADSFFPRAELERDILYILKLYCLDFYPAGGTP